jgi:hypothetical protein
MTQAADDIRPGDKSAREALEQRVRELSQQGPGLTEIARLVGLNRGAVYGIRERGRRAKVTVSREK